MQSSRPPAPPLRPAPRRYICEPRRLGPGTRRLAGPAGARRPRARGGRGRRVRARTPAQGPGPGPSERGKGRAPPAAPHLSNVENPNTSFKHLGNIRPPAPRMRPAPPPPPPRGPRPRRITPLTGPAARGCGFVTLAGEGVAGTGAAGEARTLLRVSHLEAEPVGRECRTIREREPGPRSKTRSEPTQSWDGRRRGHRLPEALPA